MCFRIDDELLVQLYDTSQTFKHRMYSALDVDLCRIRLHESIQEIMSQPLVYIRDIIPRECLECVSSISQVRFALKPSWDVRLVGVEERKTTKLT